MFARRIEIVWLEDRTVKNKYLSLAASTEMKDTNCQSILVLTKNYLKNNNFNSKDKEIGSIYALYLAW